MALVSEFQMTSLLQRGYIDFPCGSNATAGNLSEWSRSRNELDSTTSDWAPSLIAQRPFHFAGMKP
jgi:hypothetical protein